MFNLTKKHIWIININILNGMLMEFFEIFAAHTWNYNIFFFCLIEVLALLCFSMLLIFKKPFKWFLVSTLICAIATQTVFSQQQAQVKPKMMAIEVVCGLVVLVVGGVVVVVLYRTCNKLFPPPPTPPPTNAPPSTNSIKPNLIISKTSTSSSDIPSHGYKVYSGWSELDSSYYPYVYYMAVPFLTCTNLNNNVWVENCYIAIWIKYDNSATTILFQNNIPVATNWANTVSYTNNIPVTYHYFNIPSLKQTPSTYYRVGGSVVTTY